MAKSNKPAVWGPFAAGGTITAFVTPVLVLLTLFAAFGKVPEVMSYDGLRAIVSHWFGKLTLFAIISLSLWTSAHRVRITLYDLGVRSDILVATVVYLIAAAGSVAAAIYLLRM